MAPQNVGVCGGAERALVNSVLSYIAGLVVLLLFAALVGPSIVDWNSFRSEIETQISQAVGLPVTVAGDINFVILPAPRFSLQDLEIGAADGSDSLAKIGTLEGEVSLAPLLRAEIDVVRVRALNFAANITRNADGKINWMENGVPNLGGSIDPEAISLESVIFESGEVFFRDEASSENVRLANVVGELKATSLVGPLKFDGAFEYGTQSYALSLGMGAFGGDRAFPVNIDLAAPNLGWDASFSGLATEATASARLDGSIEFRLGQIEGEEEPSSFLQMNAGLVGNSEAVSLRDVELAVAGTVLKGEAEIALQGEPSVTASLAGARLALDTVLTGYQSAGVPVDFVQIPRGILGEFDLSVSDLGFGAAHASNVRAKLRMQGGELVIDSLSADFVGDTSAEIKGTISQAQGTPRFDGSVDATIGEVGIFSSWAGEISRSEAYVDTISGIAGRSSGPLRIQTKLALQPSLFQAYSFSALFGEEADSNAPVTGGFSYAYRSRPALSIELSGPEFDATGFGAFFDTEQYFVTLDPSAIDANVVLDFDTVHLPNVELTNVEVTAALAEGVLSIDRLKSTIDGTDEISAVGTVSNIGATVAGGLEGTINAALGASLSGLFLNADIPFTGAGVLSYVLRGEEIDDQHVISLEASGQLDGSETSLSFNQKRSLSDASADQLDLRLSLENAVAQDLLLSLGASTTVPIEGAGSFRLQLSGPRDGSLDTSVRLVAGDFSGSLSGKAQNILEAPNFAGRFETSAASFGLVSSVAGWQGGWVDLVSANAHDGAVVAGGELEWRSDRVALSDVEAIAGALRISGTGVMNRSGTQPSIEASIDFGNIVLDPLFVSEDEEAWSAAPLSWRALSEADGSLSVTASQISVAGLVFEDVAAKGSLTDGVLSFTPVTAELAGGRLTMGARFEGGEGVPGVGLTLALENVSVDGASKMMFGETLAGGEVTGNLQLEGQGRSLLGLVSTLTGKGSLGFSTGQLGGFDLQALRAGLDTLSTIDDFEGVIEATLRQGRTAYEKIDGSFSITEGTLNFTPENVGFMGASDVKVTAFADIVRLEADVETEVNLVGTPPLPSLTMVLSGPFRDLERRNDTLEIQQAVSQALLVRDIEEAGIDELPDALRDLIIVPDERTELDVPLEGVTGTPVPAALPETSSIPTPAERPIN